MPVLYLFVFLNFSKICHYHFLIIALDPVLDSIIGRNLIKKGTSIRFGDKEVEYNSNFRLILHTKLANPHYKPEMQAQTTLINFTVTRDGLEDQLLADVVSKERFDLEKSKANLTKSQNTFKISLKVALIFILEIKIFLKFLKHKCLSRIWRMNCWQDCRRQKATFWATTRSWRISRKQRACPRTSNRRSWKPK